MNIAETGVTNLQNSAKQLPIRAAASALLRAEELLNHQTHAPESPSSLHRLGTSQLPPVFSFLISNFSFSIPLLRALPVIILNSYFFRHPIRHFSAYS
jgi:hypothetical protein